MAGCGGSGSPPVHTREATAQTHVVHHRPVSIRLRYQPLFDLPAPLQDPGAAALGASRFVLLGGLTEADTSSAAVLQGDLAGAREVTQLPGAQHDAQAAALGGSVYLFGGGGATSQFDHILAFDTAGRSVRTAGTLPRPASDVAVAADGQQAYVVGGFDGANWLDTVVRWAPGSADRVVAHLPLQLRYASAAMVGGYVLIMGGSTPHGATTDILRFDPRTGAVRRLGRLPQPVTHGGAGVLGGVAYLVGGRGDAPGSTLGTVWAVDPLTGRVRPAGRLPRSLSDAAVVSLPGRMIIAGGSSAGSTQAAVGELVRRG
jgi:N-acetylneuraminic acid mutarotase